MRTFFVFSIMMSLFVADFSAFAANPRSARGSAGANSANASSQQAAPVAARAATRGVVKNSGTTTTQTSSAPVAARAAVRNTAKVNTTTTSSAPVNKTVGARAATIQKVVQTGSKVSVAKENTIVPQECQDAFYGCMDSFCMLDNVSGGRCQCSDRNVELDKVLEDILKLDEQTYIMATEGVERIQMGEAEDQVIARAKAAAEKVTKTDKKEETKNKRTFDLSAWNNNIFSDDSIFEAADKSLVSTFADKQGDDLHAAASDLCVSKVPAQCKEYGDMLQLVYAQRIKSDCIAYENSLKQQKNESSQKLQTAQKALRDAALEEFQNQNKYATTGECVVAFTECMQTTAECGADYTGCVTLAAKENVANDSQGVKARQTKIRSAVSGTDITLASTTMESLLAKKVICERITKQCVNANQNDAVWTAFLRNAAPAIKSAEETAERKLRMNCIPTLTECFTAACKSKIDPKDEEGSYDMCLSNPSIYKSLCKNDLEPCLAATGGSYDKPESSSLWNGLLSALAALKVDACTTQVKKCLTSDDACGDDYSGCIGLSSDAIADLCPVQKLTACQTDNRFSGSKKDTSGKEISAETEIREYVAEVAKGIALRIDNDMLATCEAAANAAMIKACGDKDECAKFALDKNIGAGTLQYQVCQVIVGTDDSGKQTLTINTGACKGDASQITREEMGLATLQAKDARSISNIQSGSNSWGFAAIGFGESSSQSSVRYAHYSKYQLKQGEYTMYTPYLSGKVDYGTSISVSDDEAKFINLLKTNNSCGDNQVCKDVDNIVESLNTSMDRIIASIESDPKVQYCMTGREVQGLKAGETFGGNTGRFPNLTNSMRNIIANQVYSTAINNYNDKLAQLEEKRDADYLAISTKYEEVAAENNEKELQQRLATNCNALSRDNSTWNYEEVITAVYSESSKICTKTTRTRKCVTTRNSGNPAKRTCKKWADPEEKTEQIQM